MLFLAALTLGCGSERSGNDTSPAVSDPSASGQEAAPEAALRSSDPYVSVDRDVTLGQYFEYLRELTASHPQLADSAIGEHLLIRANPWVVDALVGTDYYLLKSRGITSLDPQAEIVLRAGDSLRIPGPETTDSILGAMGRTVIDVNVPEFALRVIEGPDTLHTFPVRVGRDASTFLEMAGRTVDLRTQIGEGTIVRIERAPRYVNPRDNHEYFETRRDDGVVTKLPRIPFLEPELDGIRYGQLIHPTTNPETLGSARSNGCIGMSEADAWRTYYHAPLGTRIRVRYELEVVDPQTGERRRLEDIYGRGDSNGGGAGGALSRSDEAAARGPSATTMTIPTTGGAATCDAGNS